MFAQRTPDRRHLPAWPRCRWRRRGSAQRFVLRLIRDEPIRIPGASDLASLGKTTAWLNSAPLTAADLPGKIGLVELLDLHLHRLAAHAPIRSRVGRTVQGPGVSGNWVHTPEFSFEDDMLIWDTK